MTASHSNLSTRSRGFTLVELLVVIAIIGILAAFITPAYLGVRRSAFESTVSSELAQLEGSIDKFRTEYGFYPSDFSEFVAADGSVGISSAEPSAGAKSPHTAADLLATLRERVARELVGQDALNIHRLIELMDRLAPTQPGVGAVVEMACVDLACRILNVPMYTYLGGAVHDRVEFNGWIGMLPPDEAAAEARRWLDASTSAFGSPSRSPSAPMRQARANRSAPR